MKTHLLSADAPDAILLAARFLADGEPVALPTETVYGLAADAANPQAVAAIFHAKERPFFDPLIVHLPGSEWLERLAIVPEPQGQTVTRLIAKFWPGPLTILLPRRTEAVPDLVTAGSPLVALRISAHPVFQSVIRAFGKPLAAPSANRFGRISPTTGAHAFSELDGRIPLVLEAGPTSHGVESTIVALENDGRMRVLRHGPITSEQLEPFGEIIVVGRAAAAASAPGQVAGHYAPRTPLTLLKAAGSLPAEVDRRKIGYLAFRQDGLAEDIANVEHLSEHGDLRQAAARLFAALRRLDEAPVERIYAEPVPETGLGKAIMDRLRRAAAGSGD